MLDQISQNTQVKRPGEKKWVGATSAESAAPGEPMMAMPTGFATEALPAALTPTKFPWMTAFAPVLPPPMSWTAIP